MKFSKSGFNTLLALAASTVLMTPAAQAATAASGDLFLGVRASGGNGATQDYIIDLGQASQFTGATGPVAVGNIGADLTSQFGASWNTRGNVFWGIAGTTGSFAAVGSDPAKTLFATRAESVVGTQSSPWLRQNDASQGAATNKLVGLATAFVDASPLVGNVAGSASDSIIQTTTAANSWASYQPGGTTANAGPAPGVSFAFFNPSVEGSFVNGTAGSVLDLYRVKPAVVDGDIGTPGDYLGRFVLNDSGSLTFVPVAAFGVNQVQLAVTADTVNDNVGSGHIAITVTRTGDTSSATSVMLNTGNGTALAGTDYTTVSQSVSFGINEVSKVVNIPITNVTGFQADRTFTVTLSGASGGTTLGANSVETVTITEAITPSVINFASGVTYAGTEGGGTVTLQFVRSGGTSPVTATIAATDGTAVHGTDFTLASTTVSFAANATTATATVNIVAETGSQINKQFTVALTAGSTNATIDAGAVPATVYIFADDTTAPTVTINTPITNASVAGTPGGTVSLGGTATDNKGVDHILVSLNGGSFVSYPVTDFLANTTSYSVALTPVGGLNSVQVEAVDAKGNISSVAKRNFMYVVKVALTVNVTGPGTVTGKQTGAVYQVGKTYTLTAVPNGPGTTNIFNGWNGDGLTAPATALAKLSFVFSDALALNPVITAAFITNPFTSTVIGGFNGMVTASTNPVVAPSNANSGFITLAVTSAGSFTGTLKIDGQSLPLTGQFDNTGHAVFGAGRTPTVAVPRADGPSLVLSSVTMDLSPTGTHQITGTIREQYRNAVLPWSTLVASRAAFSATSPAPTNYTVNKGYYTVVIPAQAQPLGSDLTTSDYPQGDGYGSITVTTAGVATLTATLADGAVVTASAPLSTVTSGPTLTCPLFAQLYAAKAGSFGGLITLDDNQSDSDLDGSSFLWFKPYVGGQYYPYGWPEGVTTALHGAKYASVAGTCVVPGLGAVSLTGNAALMFSDGGLTSSLTKDLNLSPLNVVTRLGTPADHSYTLTLTAGTGKITGSFTHTDGTKPAFNGMVFQKGTHGGAYGYFLSTTPKEVDGTGLSGGVSLTAP